MGSFYSGFRRLFACLIGLVFFLSGMLKLIDPVGTTLIVREYLKFFNLTFLMGMDRFIAVALSLLEALVGAALLAGVWSKIVALITMVMMAFFTIVTLCLLIKNPDMDCGCFGEAIHLTHLQTFLKNIVLCVFCIPAFLPFKLMPPPRNSRYVGFGIGALIILAVAVYSHNHLPLVDFTPYAPQSEVFGANGNFDQDAPVLSFKDDYGDYYDELATIGKVIIYSAYEPEKLDAQDWARITDSGNEALMNGANCLILVSAANTESVPLELRLSAYTTDYRTAIALNRSNGGATYLEDGTVIAKWDKNSIPAGDEMFMILARDATEYSVKNRSRGRVWLQAAGITCLAALLLL